MLDVNLKAFIDNSLSSTVLFDKITGSECVLVVDDLLTRKHIADNVPDTVKVVTLSEITTNHVIEGLPAPYYIVWHETTMFFLINNLSFNTSYVRNLGE